MEHMGQYGINLSFPILGNRTTPISILIGDKHTIFRQGLKALLRMQEGFVLSAEAINGQEAWSFIERLQPDVAILEIHLPEMTGIEIARKASQAGLATQVILLTAQEDLQSAVAAQEAGVAGFILKNNPFEELVTAVQTVSTGGTFVTPVIRAKLREWQRQGKSYTTLSPRELDVIRLIAWGKTSKEIARDMGISPRTVDTYRERFMEKLGLHTVADVVRYAVRSGMVE